MLQCLYLPFATITHRFLCKVSFLLVAFLFVAFCPICDSFVQENVCQIQSYIRKVQGSSAGNLLRVHLNANGTEPVAISFNGTCTDSAMLTEFILAKKDHRGTLLVTIHWKEDRRYILGINNTGGLIIKRAKVSNKHMFQMMDTPRKCLICRLAFKSFSSAPLYMMTDTAGLPLTGTDPSQRGTWYDVMRTFCSV